MPGIAPLLASEATLAESQVALDLSTGAHKTVQYRHLLHTASPASTLYGPMLAVTHTRRDPCTPRPGAHKTTQCWHLLHTSSSARTLLGSMPAVTHARCD